MQRRQQQPVFSPESLSLLLADLELLLEHFSVHHRLVLPLLYGSLQLQLPLLQGEHAVRRVVQQVPHPLHLHLQDVLLQHFVLTGKKNTSLSFGPRTRNIITQYNNIIYVLIFACMLF